ncbi:MAG: hypothetical protein LBI38_06030 [Oscillospiraceae bacterium]|jgi:uncharacterized membrane protein|nr:hypothetical protein [Oscillospiraceae bacterium]
MKIKRNYQLLQFLLDCAALFMLYLFAASIIDFFSLTGKLNGYMVAPDAEKIKLNPYPVIVWGAVAFLVFAAGVVAPFAYKKKTKMSQKQYDLWVYAVLTARIPALIVVFDLMGRHANHIMRVRESVFSFPVLAGAVLIFFIANFAKGRIKLLERETKTAKTKKG